MVWNTLVDLTNGDVVDETDMDEIRENIEYLLSPNKAIVVDASGNKSTTSVYSGGGFVNIDGTNLTATITTHGGPVMVYFSGVWYHSSAGQEVWFDIANNGTRLIGGHGQIPMGPSVANEKHQINIVLLVDLPAGTYTFTPQWTINSSGTAYLWASNVFCPALFGAIER